MPAARSRCVRARTETACARRIFNHNSSRRHRFRAKEMYARRLAVQFRVPQCLPRAAEHEGKKWRTKRSPEAFKTGISCKYNRVPTSSQVDSFSVCRLYGPLSETLRLRHDCLMPAKLCGRHCKSVEHIPNRPYVPCRQALPKWYPQ